MGDWWHSTHLASGGATPSWWLESGANIAKRRWYQHSLIGANTGGNLGVPGGVDWWNRYVNGGATPANASSSGSTPTVWALIV